MVLVLGDRQGDKPVSWRTSWQPGGPRASRTARGPGAHIALIALRKPEWLCPDPGDTATHTGPHRAPFSPVCDVALWRHVRCAPVPAASGPLRVSSSLLLPPGDEGPPVPVSGDTKLLALSAKGRLMICSLDLSSEASRPTAETAANSGRKVKELLSAIGSISER